MFQNRRSPSTGLPTSAQGCRKTNRRSLDANDEFGVANEPRNLTGADRRGGVVRDRSRGRVGADDPELGSGRTWTRAAAGRADDRGAPRALRLKRRSFGERDILKKAGLSRGYAFKADRLRPCAGAALPQRVLRRASSRLSGRPSSGPGEPAWHAHSGPAHQESRKPCAGPGEPQLLGRVPTSCGSPTSPRCPPGLAGCTSRSCSILEPPHRRLGDGAAHAPNLSTRWRSRTGSPRGGCHSDHPVYGSCSMGSARPGDVAGAAPRPKSLSERKVFGFIGHNPGHSALGYKSPTNFERLNHAA